MPPSTNRGCSVATSRAVAGEIAFASTYRPPNPAASAATSSAACGGHDREQKLALGDERRDGAGVAQAARPAPAVASLRPADAHSTSWPSVAERVAERRAHLARMQQPDDHRTSASTKAKNASEMTPFIVKNAASSRRRSPGRTSECS